MNDLCEVVNKIEKIFEKANREVELKGVPMRIWEGEEGAVWILKDGSIWVGEWDGDEWVKADIDLEKELMMYALLELGVKMHYDQIVHGVKDDG